MQIAKNNVVHIDYTLTDNDGNILDSSEGREPLAYIHGIGNLIPGLEKELEGKATGDHIDAKVAPEDAYGLRDINLEQTVHISNFDQPEQVQKGIQFQAQTEDGQTKIATIVDISGEEVKIDMNHPLSGMELNFSVDVKEIRKASEEELSHGHVHGAGGHDH